MPTSKTTRARTTTSTSSSKRGKTKAVDSLPVVDPEQSPLDDGVGYEIDKQINLPQLQGEIESASGTDNVNVALSKEQNPEDPNAAVIWLTPAGLDASMIAQVVADHVPDQMWGVPQATQDFNEALSRLRQDPDGPLSAADQKALVKGIALNFTALMPPPPTS